MFFSKVKKINYISVLILLLGLCIFCYPVILSKGAFLPGHLGDTRWANYTLEHSYMYLHQMPLHTSLFDMPFYFPNTNTLSFSDMLLGAMLIYIPIREIISNSQNALIVWFVITCIFNYYAMYFLLKKVFKFNELPASVGALLFAFSSPRQNQIIHLQFQTLFYSILSLISFLSINYNKGKLYNNICFFLGSIFFVIQLYSSFYSGWYMVYGFTIYIFIVFFSKEYRKSVIDFIKNYKLEIVLYSIITFILLIPLVKHYLAIGSQFLIDTNNTISLYGLISSNSVIDNLIFRYNPFFKDINNINFENICGVGFVATILILIGLFYKNQYKKYILTFMFISLIFFVNSHLYKLLYYYFPGATAIRATPRIIFLLLPIYSYLIANFFQKVKLNKSIITCLIFLLLIDFIYSNPFYFWTKEEHIDNLKEYIIPNNCNIVYFKYNEKNSKYYIADYQLGVMWKSLQKGVYSINGYSGYEPALIYSAAANNCIVKDKI